MNKNFPSLTEDQVLLGPFNHLLQAPGKEIRSKLAIAFNMWLNIPEDKLKIIIETVQMLHNASLLLDDIEDDSDLRRGIPVAHHIYGIPHTINTANYVIFLGLQKAQTLGHSEVTAVFTEQILELLRGQGMDIYWRDSNMCPTEEEYITMVKRKTGGLFGLAVRLMQLFSKNNRNLHKLSDDLGLYFQIRDDYVNLTSSEVACNKGFAEDLTEGKFSFPIIHGITNQPGNDQIRSILRQKTRQIDVKKYCISCLDSIGSFAYTRNVLKELEIKILSQVENEGGNEILSSTIKKLSEAYQNS